MLRSKNGSAIIIVLIMFIIAMGLTMFSLNVSRKIINSSDMLIDKLHAKMGAKSDIEKLKFYISTGRFYSLYVENSRLLNLPKKLYIDERRQDVDNDSVFLKGSGGLINVWNENANRIDNILKNKKSNNSQQNTIKDSILDWYDEDDFRRINGAESAYYKEKGYRYTPRNFSGVQSIYELHLIKGLTDNETFNDIENYLILCPRQSININTCDDVMLSSLFDIPIPYAESLERIKDVKNGLELDDISKIAGYMPDAMMYGVSPTFVLDIKVNFRFNKAVESIRCIIDFHSDDKVLYKVIKWQN